jgi:hypothetical protein
LFIYNRKGSAITELKKGDIDWDEIMAGKERARPRCTQTAWPPFSDSFRKPLEATFGKGYVPGL